MSGASIKTSILFRKCFIFVAGLFLLTTHASAALATDQKDLIVGLKTLPLLDDKIIGATVVAIIFDPASIQSKADAAAIKTAIDGGLTAPGGVTLRSLMISASDLSQISEAKIAFIAEGTSIYFSAIGMAAAKANVLTLSTDLACVRNADCILGVVSDPHVEIYYSKAASTAAKIGFSPIFSMLVKQI